MGIKYCEEQQIFKLDTPTTSYVCAVVEGYLLHAYYGAKIGDDDIKYRMRIYEAPFTPLSNNRDKGVFLDSAYFEYPTEGIGDYRNGAIGVRTSAGHMACDLEYSGYCIYRGKKQLEGLPSTVAGEDEAESLEIYLQDKVTGLEVTLTYTVFEQLDAICRNVSISNHGDDTLYLESALSMCLDMDNEDYDMISLHGSWARERCVDRERIGYGRHVISSIRGESSHQMHPFMAVIDNSATQTQGQVYGFSFVYSGNFAASIERGQHDSIRCLMGINPEGFGWRLHAGKSFQTPEVIMVYSASGIEQMTHTYHDVFREHLICKANPTSRYAHKSRPVLINNWEATYFDFDSDKLLDIAKEASKNGIEMLVMDDGWFGNRSSDNMALGDWYVNEDKLKGGLKKLVDGVNELGLKFGIWIEPEMVSPDSELYREHPDWAIAVPGRVGTLMRNQYVLDFSRRKVRDEIYSRISAVLSSCNIEYVKWDMNRALCDIGSVALDADAQGELFHRYMLGVYEMQQRLADDYPHILLENCSGGGARFDPGMLYYSPQIWCSDDTDAIERLSIQEGTALIYPLSTMGAHVSDCPNHTVGRVTPFETRGYVALAGTFGYELDITKIPADDRAMIPGQIEMYHRYNDLIRCGDYYRISSYRENHYNDCWEIVSKDKKKALVTYIKVISRPNRRSVNIRLRGLEEDRYYRVLCDKRVLSLDYPSLTADKASGTSPAEEAVKVSSDYVLSGATLMNVGLLINENIPEMSGDYRGVLIELTAVER